MTDFDYIAKAFGGQKRGLGALAFDQRVSRKRCAMNDQLNIAGRHSGLGNDRAQNREHTRFRGARRGQALGRIGAIADFERHIGERAADIDTKPDCGRRCHARTANNNRAPSKSLVRWI